VDASGDLMNNEREKQFCLDFIFYSERRLLQTPFFKMVYCGKPSKGCATCREKKTRVSWPFLDAILLERHGLAVIIIIFFFVLWYSSNQRSDNLSVIGKPHSAASASEHAVLVQAIVANWT
jgi:hypothetical protein